MVALHLFQAYQYVMTHVHQDDMKRETDRVRTSARSHTSVGLLVLLFVAGCGGSTTVPASPAQPERAAAPTGEAGVEGGLAASIDQLLDRSGIESIVSGRAGPFTRRVALLVEDLTDPELERLVPAVRPAFAADRLRQDVATRLEREAPGPATVRDILAWNDSGPVAEMRRIADAHEPSLSLLEYARSLPENPPDRERAELIARWVQAQQAGLFYVLMDQALAEAAHTIWRAFRPGAPAFTPLQGPALEARLAQSFDAAVVSALHRYEAVPDSVLGRAVSTWESEAGQWYVEAYSLAVAEAIRSAGERVARAVTGTSRDRVPSRR